ncbi:hypothetical protein Caferm_10205 [Corynebacterium afermentans subsp. afermentans]|nr:hypothetical protein Caferm_10205 [Corynebacterium afermentans subsp. afermentans]
MLRTISRPLPSSSSTWLTATWVFGAFSSSSMSECFVRPMTRSCSSTGRAFQSFKLCTYFCSTM